MRAIAISVGVVVAGILASTMGTETDATIEQADAFIEAHDYVYEESETVSLSYAEWQEQQAMDVWELGSQYGISELDTTRALKLITYEGYGDSPLSYYVGCVCWQRCTDGYEGNLFSSFGGMDFSYGEWMDEIEIADYAYDALTEAYTNPTYVTSCNGMEVPADYIYAEWTEDGMIYVW